ncbi:MAG TPA: hypothetical protein DDX40_07500 [Rikenellaceae bacterium]|nr:hypothetical protein [Rikenellaceae bacterium]
MPKTPNIVFIGGIESGKTSTIESLWSENVNDYRSDKGVLRLKVSEMLIGREVVDFDVIELPRVNFTSSEWIKKPDVKDLLEAADIIVYILPCDDSLINIRKQYLEKVFDSLHLKDNLVFIIGYGMADWILNPIASRNLEIAKSRQVGLTAVSNIMQKTNIVFNEFSSFTRYAPTFSIDSIIPYSNTLSWNIDLLKYQIWNGLVMAMNEYVFDPSLPTLVLSGKTGCGKTSTINALWNLNLATGRVVSCTKFPAVIHIEDEYNGKNISFNLVDLPGIAESMDANSVYKKFYYKFIAKASVLVCLSQADRRAYKQDQIFYSDLIKNRILLPSQNIILGINQADLLFKDVEHPDGIDLHTIDGDNNIISEKSNDYFNSISEVFAGFSKVTPESVSIYSVHQDWNLKSLKNKIYKLL